MSSNKKRPLNPTVNSTSTVSDTTSMSPPKKKKAKTQGPMPKKVNLETGLPYIHRHNIDSTSHCMLLLCQRAANASKKDNLHTEMNENDHSHDKEISSWSIRDYKNINPIHYVPEEYHIDYITEGCHQPNQSSTTSTSTSANTANNLQQHEIDYFLNLSHYSDYPNTNYLDTSSLSQPPYKPKQFEFISQCASMKLYQSELKIQNQLEEYKSIMNSDGDCNIDNINCIDYYNVVIQDEHENKKRKNAGLSTESLHATWRKKNYGRQKKSNHDNHDENNIDEIYHSFFQNYNFEQSIQQWQCENYYSINKNNKNKKKSKSNKTKTTRKKANPKQNCDQTTTMIKYYNQKLKDIQNLYHNFDETAMIAFGYIIQECMIRTFLPLATFHVKRCRYLEEKKFSKSSSDQIDYNIDYDPFVQWTLPPDKAIVNFCHDENISSPTTDMVSYYLPSSSITSMRRSNLNNDNNTTVDDIISTTLSSNNEKHKNHFTSWCNIHGLDKKFVLDNIDLFQFLIDDYHYDVNDDEDLMSWQRSKVDDGVDIRLSLAKACLSNNNKDSIEDEGNNKDKHFPIPFVIH